MTLKRIPKHLIFDPQPKRRSKAWVGWLLLTLLGIAAGIVAGKANAAQSAFLPEAGLLTTRHAGSEPSQALHTGTQVNATIDGMIVSVNYTQRFRNASSHWVEGIYTFPLPEGAAVRHMEIRVGERRIVGKIKPREEATRIYRQALSSGKQAALTVQQRPNLFTQRIANIAPGETIEVQLQFIDKARYQQGTFEWRLPATITPRYMPGTLLPLFPPVPVNRNDEVSLNKEALGFGWAHPTSEVPDAGWISPPMETHDHPVVNPIGINVTLTPGVALTQVNGLYHDISVEKNNNSYTVFLADGQAEMDRDFVLQWQPTPSQEPRAALFKQTLGNEHYALFMLMPPTTLPETSLARDITFVIDISGSMQGNAIAQAKASLRYAVNQLSGQDRFNIVAFSNDYQLLYASPQWASPNAKYQATNWVARLDADGGTEMYPALEAAFAQSLTPERLQQVVFITDGAVGNESALFSLIEAQSQDVRLFTVGIGAAPNSYFMREAARAGRGTYEYIARSSEVSSIMQRLFTKLNHATTKNIAVNWPVATEAFPAKSGDLYFSEPLIALAKSAAPIPAIEVTGNNGVNTWHRVVNAYQVEESQGISALWARAKISGLEASHRRGKLDDIAVRNRIVDVALKHHMLSRFTAFVAVDDSIARPSKEQIAREVVRSQQPLNQHLQKVPFPQTATSSTFSFIAGALLLSVWLSLRCVLLTFTGCNAK